MPYSGTRERATIKKETAAMISVAAGLVLGLIAIGGSGWKVSMNGLPGESLTGAPADLRDVWSFIDLITAAFVEELAVRGWIQFRLQPLIGSAIAELIADFLFVLLHFFRFIEPGGWGHAIKECVFVILVGTVNGRIAAKSQSVLWPVTAHIICNGIVFVVAFLS